MNEIVGIVGLGIMGSAYATHLLKNGFQLVGYDANPERQKAMEALGMIGVDSPKEVALKCSRVITSLPSPGAFHQVMTGAKGLIEAQKPLIVADTCTLALSDKVQAHGALAAVGITLLDCPVSGTGAQAVKGDLVFLASGEHAAFLKMEPILQAIARKVHHLGEFGSGSKMKYVANLLVAIHNVSTAEAMAFGMKAGIAPEMIYEVLRESAATSRIFEVRGPMMVANQYSENVSATFVTMAKDLSIIKEYTQSIDCPTPLFSLASSIHSAAISQGMKHWDTASVCVVMERLCGLKRD